MVNPAAYGRNSGKVGGWIENIDHDHGVLNSMI
jgi:hypothetical protein